MSGSCKCVCYGEYRFKSGSKYTSLGGLVKFRAEYMIKFE